MLEMKADRRSAGWTSPQLLLGKPMERIFNFIRGLQQSVRYWLKLRRYAGYGAAEPCLRT
jgi:hypothetical protein